MKLLSYLQYLHPTDKVSHPKIFREQLLYYRVNNRLVEAKLCVEPKQYPISDLEINIETRNKQIYIYIFHKNFIYDYFDDSCYLYEILDKTFYDNFEYVLDKNNLFSLNQYTPKTIKSEQECIDFLKSINFKIM